MLREVTNQLRAQVAAAPHFSSGVPASTSHDIFGVARLCPRRPLSLDSPLKRARFDAPQSSNERCKTDSFLRLRRSESPLGHPRSPSTSVFRSLSLSNDRGGGVGERQGGGRDCVILAKNQHKTAMERVELRRRAESKLESLLLLGTLPRSWFSRGSRGISRRRRRVVCSARVVCAGAEYRMVMCGLRRASDELWWRPVRRQVLRSPPGTGLAERRNNKSTKERPDEEK